MPSNKLHLIREKDPSKDGLVPGGVHRAFCPDCHEDVFIIHLETQAVDPGVKRP